MKLYVLVELCTPDYRTPQQCSLYCTQKCYIVPIINSTLHLWLEHGVDALAIALENPLPSATNTNKSTLHLWLEHGIDALVIDLENLLPSATAQCAFGWNMALMH
jgi:hypothetical protein